MVRFSVAFCLFAAAQAHAALPWDQYYVPGERVISQAALDESTLIAERFYREKLGVHLKLSTRRAVPAPVGAYANNLASIQSYGAFDYFAGRLRPFFKPARIATVVHYPIKDESTYYYAGLAWTRGIGAAGPKHPYSLVWCGDKSARSCALVMAHEVGHVLGARHWEVRPNFMHPAAGQWAEQEWEINPFTLPQIRRRLRRVGLWDLATTP